MLAFIPAVVLAAFAPLASATLTITSPTSAGWTGNSSVLVSWTFGQDDPNFSVELGNPHIQSGLLAQGPIAVANNIPPNTGSFTFELPVIPAGDSYFLAFVAIDNVNNVYANSSFFPIRANPTSSSVPLSSVKTSSGAPGSSTHPATTTRNGTSTGTSTGTATSTGILTNTITSSAGSSSFTVLSITSLNPNGTASTTSTSTTTTGAASRTEAAWYVGFVTALLGAMLA